MRGVLAASLTVAVIVAGVTACEGAEEPASDAELSGVPAQRSSQTSMPAASTTPSDGFPTVALPRLERLRGTTLPLSGAPAAMVPAFGALWVQSHRGTNLYRLDAETGAVTATIDTGVPGCGDLVPGAGSVWLTGCMALGLIKVDPRTARVQATSEVDGLGPAFADGELWIGSSGGLGVHLRRADPGRLGRARVVKVAGLAGAEGVVSSAGSIWVSDETSAVVYQVDPATEEVQAAIPMPLPPDAGYLIEHDGAPWYVDAAQGALVRVDPHTGTPSLLTVRLEKPSEYWGIAASTAPGPPGRLWMRSGDQEAWLIDTRTDRVLRRVALRDGGGGDVQEIGGTLWASGFGIDRVQRIPVQ